MTAAVVRAQAKINLFLRVVGREASGYHDIETLFCRIALADTVHVRLTSGARSLECSGPELPADGLGSVAENLAWRAAMAYSDHAGWPAGFAITLEKHIPVRAGLGGGSADAGAVLRTLNTLNPRPLEEQPLLRIAASLGTDVVFLTQERTSLALASGRGDHLIALAPLAPKPCIVAVPPDGVSTRDAYEWLDRERAWTDGEVPAPATPFRAPRPLTWADAARVAHNDFEEAIFPRFRNVAAAAEWLRTVPLHSDPSRIVLMSGSGSAVFAIIVGPMFEHLVLPAPPVPLRATITTTSDRVESVRLID